jgi:arylsulfatase A-like enzyme
MKSKLNIILITIDALRADHLGFLGYQKNITPNLDRLAKESIIFTQAFSVGPSTPYSFPAILTSTYPLDFKGPQKIERPRILISEILQKAGYITCAIHSNPYLSSYFGYDRGWDYFEDVTSPFGQLPRGIERKLRKIFIYNLKSFIFSFHPPLFLWLKFLKDKLKEKKSSFKIKAGRLNQLAKDFLLSVKEEKKPFFLWIHYMDVHSPYFPKEHYEKNKPLSYQELVAGSYINYLIDFGQKEKLRNYLKKFMQKTIQLYDEGIEYVDQEIGKFLDFLKENNFYENTILCLTSDHGEELFDHGGIEHPGISYFSRKLYNELLHVPLIIKIPKRNPQRIERKVSLIDLPSTLLSLSDLSLPSSFKGKNFFENPTFPIFHQVAPHITDIFVSQKEILKILSEYKIAIQTKNWKYIFDNKTKEEELYNLLKDPKEKENLAKTEIQVLKEMREKVKDFIKGNF